MVNHMCQVDGDTGTGSWGSDYDTGTLTFPAVPYNESDFNCCDCEMCSTSSCSIDDYNEVNHVRNCRLVGTRGMFRLLFLTFGLKILKIN